MPGGDTAVQGIVTKASPHSVDRTIERLETIVEQKGLRVFARFDHSDEAQRVGLTMQPAHVLVFGSPRAGTPLMVARPMVALDLPLKALVWQDAEGSVWVSYPRPSYLAERYDIPAELVKNIAGIEALVADAVEP
jgi:uncharacterized protein (DUF302 family)